MVVKPELATFPALKSLVYLFPVLEMMINHIEPE